MARLTTSFSHRISAKNTMTTRLIYTFILLLLTNSAYSAPVYEIKVTTESHNFSIDAAAYIGIDFSPGKIGESYGSGEISFKLNGENKILKFNLTTKNLLQVWHDKNELKLIFHDESSVKYDKTFGDDITLTIITKSNDGRTYEGEYTLQLRQHGFKTNLIKKGKIKFNRSSRYYP
ncbi:MAG: hypothetical protein ACJAR1_001628 [Rubritalea sp.]|jgi:hypothetical protein